MGSFPAGCARTSSSPHSSRTSSLRGPPRALPPASGRRRNQVGEQPAPAASPLQRDQHVLLDREPPEHLLALERAPDALPRPPRRAPTGDVATAVDHTPARRRPQPREHVEQGGLARAVRSDESEDLARTHLDRHVVQRHHAPEADRHVDRVQHRCARVGARRLELRLGGHALPPLSRPRTPRVGLARCPLGLPLG